MDGHSRAALTVNSLINDCRDQLYFYLCLWFDNKQVPQPAWMSRHACAQSLKLNRRGSLRMDQELCITYSCAIAHQLARQPDGGSDPAVIAAELGNLQAHQLTSLDHASDPLMSTPASFLLTLVPKSQGYLDIKVSWMQLIQWLNTNFVALPGRIATSAPLREPSSSCFTDLTEKLHLDRVGYWQYSHARCCSLLEQAAIANLIPVDLARFTHPTCNPPSPRDGVLSHVSIPWDALRRSNLRPANAERELLLTLILVLDQVLVQDDQPLPFQRIDDYLQALCLAFHTFHANCRIWEALKEHDQALALARVGLISLTQRCLWGLMVDGLGLNAPLRL